MPLNRNHQPMIEARARNVQSGFARRHDPGDHEDHAEDAVEPLPAAVDGAEGDELVDAGGDGDDAEEDRDRVHRRQLHAKDDEAHDQPEQPGDRKTHHAFGQHPRPSPLSRSRCVLTSSLLRSSCADPMTLCGSGSRTARRGGEQRRTPRTSRRMPTRSVRRTPDSAPAARLRRPGTPRAARPRDSSKYR